MLSKKWIVWMLNQTLNLLISTWSLHKLFNTCWSHRPNQLTHCCTQLKPPGVRILCALYLLYNVVFTYKSYGNTWNKRVWIGFNVELANLVYWARTATNIIITIIVRWVFRVTNYSICKTENGLNQECRMLIESIVQENVLVVLKGLLFYWYFDKLC